MNRRLVTLTVLGLFPAPCCSAKNGPSLRHVSRSDFGEAWPLTVSAGTVECTRVDALPTHIVVFRTEAGVAYALNGTAKAHGLADIRPIWRDDPRDARLKVNLAPLIDLGLKACAEDSR